jgi:hypothetical protein
MNDEFNLSPLCHEFIQRVHSRNMNIFPERRQSTRWWATSARRHTAESLGGRVLERFQRGS